MTVIPFMDQDLKALSIEDASLIKHDYTQACMKCHADDIRKYRDLYGEMVRAECSRDRAHASKCWDAFYEFECYLKSFGIQPKYINFMSVGA